MPPKQRITREMILERSFEMFCREGMDVINARSVAKALNCSTQPIFSYFSGMQDLKTALEEKAAEQFEAALHAQNQTGDPLVKTGCAYTRFAAEQPKLFAHLVTIRKEDPTYPFVGKDSQEALARQEAEQLALTMEQASALCAHMAIYIHGLAVMGTMQPASYTPERMAAMIEEMHGMLLKTIRA